MTTTYTLTKVFPSEEKLDVVDNAQAFPKFKDRIMLCVASSPKVMSILLNGTEPDMEKATDSAKDLLETQRNQASSLLYNALTDAARARVIPKEEKEYLLWWMKQPLHTLWTLIEEKLGKQQGSERRKNFEDSLRVLQSFDLARDERVEAGAARFRELVRNLSRVLDQGEQTPTRDIERVFMAALTRRFAQRLVDEYREANSNFDLEHAVEHFRVKEQYTSSLRAPEEQEEMSLSFMTGGAKQPKRAKLGQASADQAWKCRRCKVNSHRFGPQCPAWEPIFCVICNTSNFSMRTTHNTKDHEKYMTQQLGAGNRAGSKKL